MGIDIIKDSAGVDTIAFGDQITLDKLSFTRDVGTQDDLIIKLLDTDIAIINDQFSGGAIETLSFADGSTADISSVSLSLQGTDEAETLHGTAQADIMIGGLGADIFVLSDATVVDTITDFSDIEGDVLDIANILDGYDPLNDAISDFVNMTSNGSDTTISVDVNGTSAHTDIVTLQSWTTTDDLQTLINNGTIVV